MTLPRQLLPARRLAQAAAAAGLALATMGAFAADPSFASTTDVSAWTVSTVVGGTDGQLSSFSTADFQAAAAFSGRPGWISNNTSGSNAGITTFFVFRQTFTLTAQQAATADLQFTWAADDSGQGFANRGTWVPQYSLNGGTLVQGVWPGGYSYDLGSATELTHGFVAGKNTLDFYVEGNGTTDGLALATTSFTAAVPEPATTAMLLAGLGLMGLAAQRRARRGD